MLVHIFLLQCVKDLLGAVPGGIIPDERRQQLRYIVNKHFLRLGGRPQSFLFGPLRVGFGEAAPGPEIL